MADKVTITVEAAKLRELVYTETYTNKEGQEVSVQKVRFEIVPLKEPKKVHSATKYDLVKTHFAAKVQTKEEREAKADPFYIGEGVTTVWKNDSPAPAVETGGGSSSEGKDDDLPFN